MIKSTHINVWLTTSLLLIINTLTFNIFFIFYMIFSLFADLDHWQWSLNKKLKIKLPFKHRGFSHTLLFQIIITWLVGYLFTSLGYEVTKIDYLIIFWLLLSHLLADIFTVSWFPFFWPLFKKRITIPWISVIKTSTKGEFIFNLLVTFFNLYLLFYIFSKGFYHQITWIDKTSNFVTSSIWIEIGIFIAFFLFWYHIISSEIKNLKHDTKRLWKKFLQISKNLVIWFIILSVISYLLQNNLFKDIPLLNFILGSIILVIIQWIALFYKDIEFISKSSWYLVNIIVLIWYIFITFNFFWYSNYITWKDGIVTKIEKIQISTWSLNILSPTQVNQVSTFLTQTGGTKETLQQRINRLRTTVK